MDIKQLHYFVTVSDLLSYSKAAQKLHISQPSLSNAIKNLEQEVGSPLLERNTRKIELTDAGNILYQKAILLLSQMDTLKKEMAEVKETGSGQLIIGIIESAKHWVPKVIRNYQEHFPSMNIKLIEVLSGQAVKDSLRKYHTHLLITNQSIQEDDLQTIPLYIENLVLVLHRSHPLAQQESVSLKEVVAEPFIISTEGFQTRENILSAFAMEDVEPRIKFEIERFETALSLIRENLGITIIPENYLAGVSDPSIVRKKIDSSFLQRTVFLAYLKNRYLTPAVRAFLAGIQEEFGCGRRE
ncbi:MULTISPECIES: LysR family transcriptional regulator [Brevibacillus]|uniref:LysR family transcriptional regulator n=1 Tax=Brevibacillus TaxID=55080 RepID=UPI000EDAAC43|nr:MULTISPECIES: LysR family transcriptional regulator [Brevibacillus]WDV93644.1 LysR family transcriptional regulator [Brevibacillus parabrevis]HBZ79009.1 LysR family transcriptional regulator [Brevibacillus sp.]